MRIKSSSPVFTDENKIEGTSVRDAERTESKQTSSHNSQAAQESRPNGYGLSIRRAESRIGSDMLADRLRKTAASASAERTASQRNGTVKLYAMPEAGDKPIVDALNKAKKSIDVEVYMLADRDVINALKSAARRGVEVRVMLEPKPIGDTDGKNEDYNKLKADLRSAGIQVKATPPKFDSDENVDHAKFIVIDDRELLFGTGNLVTAGLGGGKFGTNRDFWVDDKRAASAAEAEKLFDADWNRKSTRNINFKNLVVTPDNGEARIISLIDGAKNRLYVYNQEIYSDNLIDRLIAAKKRGADVRVLVAEQKGNGVARNGYNDNKDAIKRLKAAGVTVKEFGRYYMHAKAVVADNRAFIGSQNFSAGGLRKNRELGEIIENRTIADRLANIFLSDMNSSKR